MKKKNRFKSWLIRVLRKWLAKLEPYHNVIKVEHVPVPLVTIMADTRISERDNISQNDINKILEKQLAGLIIQYADIEKYDQFSIDCFNQYTTYRATIRVVADKRG